MPSFNTALYAAQAVTAGGSANASASFPQKQTSSGDVRILRIEHALVGTEATADTVNLAVLPIGAKVLPAYSKIVCEDPGTALTVDIGHAGNADAYCDGAALTTAHDDFWTKLPSVTAVAAQYVPEVVTEANKVLVATLVLVTVPTAGAKITFYVAFVDTN
jgi:hypothetical protein